MYKRRTGSPVKGMINELLRCQLWPVEIAPCDAVAANVDLPDDTDGHRIAVCIEYVDLRIRNRSAIGLRIIGGLARPC